MGAVSVVKPTVFPTPGDWPSSARPVGFLAPWPELRARLAAGTTHASLAAGTPTLICSVFGDQPFWGAQCRHLGVGATVPFARLNTQRLTSGLRAVLESKVAARAREVARRMGDEDGIAAAVAHLEHRMDAL